MKNYMDITVTTCYIVTNVDILFFFLLKGKKHVKKNGIGGHC